MELQQERFEAWLFSQPDDRAFSMTIGCHCLVASFIRENTPHQHAVCSWTNWAETIEAWSAQKRHELPLWAIRMIDPIGLQREFGPEWIRPSAAQLKARYRKLFKFPPTDWAKLTEETSVMFRTVKSELTFDQLQHIWNSIEVRSVPIER